MSDPKQTSDRLQALVAECEQTIRETEALIDRTCELNEADAKLARALNDADLDGDAPRSEGQCRSERPLR
jgi:hypothetical protein